MGRLDEKWATAGGVVASIEKEIEGNLDALIARKAELSNKTKAVFSKQNAPIDEANAALDALDSKLNLLSNGGPNGPLPGSEGLQDSQKPPVVSQTQAAATPQPETTQNAPAPAPSPVHAPLTQGS